MNIEQIEKFVEKQAHVQPRGVKITFRNRDTIYGMFVEGKDYKDLKAKNFWRIVAQPNIDKWNELKDMGLAKIFHGSLFTKLGVNDKPGI